MGKTAIAVIAATGTAIFALNAAASSPKDSAHGALSVNSVWEITAHIAFSASSDAAFQASGGASGTADGMMNFEPSAVATDLPPVGRVNVSCLNVVDNRAIITGTVTDPVSTNAFTGPPFNFAPNRWIIGAAVIAVDQHGAGPDQARFGYFVNADKDHELSTPRCFGSDLVNLPAATIDKGNVIVYGVAAPPVAR